MNAKKAKLLRKMVKRLKEQGATINGECSYNVDNRKQKVVKYQDVDENGNVTEKEIVLSPGTMTVNKTTERGLYKQFKKSA